ncbi:MAG: hypothetical protein K9G44_08440 [Melioribacteraceae bacterium]|nr:hypothetical protein [Melioribacteraceae bacterium]
MQKKYVIEDFHKNSNFASFLPGVAGLKGIPMWVFYVNRGQAIASFGIESKDNSIMEFFPANKSYQQVSSVGFRTFIKKTTGSKNEIVEPFSQNSLRNSATSMSIGMNELVIREVNPVNGIQTTITYFTIPNDNIAALARRVSLKNISPDKIVGEYLDGMPVVIPFGVNNFFMKEMANTAVAWMGVTNYENKIPYYKIHSSIEDKPEVEEFEAGNFYLTTEHRQGNDILLSAIIDPKIIFEYDNSFTFPYGLDNHNLSDLFERKQNSLGQLPCGFFGNKFNLEPGETLNYSSIIGNIDDVKFLNMRQDELKSDSYFTQKHAEAIRLTDALTSTMETKTSDENFNLYCRQNYLDNLLRGGKPIIFNGKERDIVYYIYSRKHGDLERDYNFFKLAAEYYSQGNGNFRDVNQNRRSDLLLNPSVGDYLIRTFMNFIQIDGNNPLVIKGATLSIAEINDLESILNEVSEQENKEKLKELLSDDFTLGKLLKLIENYSISLNSDVDEFISLVLSKSVQNSDADFGEGYWIDHWTYNLDLMDKYLTIFPDKVEELFYSTKDYTFFDNYAFVEPRSERYVMVQGKIRQLHSIHEDEKKKELIDSRKSNKNLLHTNDRIIYKTDLFSKLIHLSVLKFCTIDSFGMGIEMESEKPGWYDALNGLPGMFGSSMSETVELQRLLKLILSINGKYKRNAKLPTEFYELFKSVQDTLSNEVSAFERWDLLNSAKEKFRSKVTYSIQGDEKELSADDVNNLAEKMLAVVAEGIKNAEAVNNNILPTYFYYDAENYEIQTNSAGEELVNEKRQKKVKINKFKQTPLPLFLEGVVKSLKSKNVEDAKVLLTKVKTTGLYDKKLKMYKVNASLLSMPHSIGRTRAFTPGWLENESIFLHMHYKFVLAMLKSGLYTDFLNEMRDVLVPFFKREVYGRSILENSSFIASSVHPDESIHGKGFVARLSGSTAEFIEIWFLMFVGKSPFSLDESGNLQFKLSPTLPFWLFNGNSGVSFRLFDNIEVIYKNNTGKDVFPGSGSKIAKYEIYNGESVEEIDSDYVDQNFAIQIRDRKVDKIIATIE